MQNARKAYIYILEYIHICLISNRRTCDHHEVSHTSGNRDEMIDFFSNDKKTGGLKGHTILCFNP
jgi:hypothetical protein